MAGAVVYQILYTEDSLEDLRVVLDYIDADNPHAAQRLGIALLNHVELLSQFPRLGASIQERTGIRVMLHAPIRIYYRIHEEKPQIEVLHFWHVARRPPIV